MVVPVGKTMDSRRNNISIPKNTMAGLRNTIFKLEKYYEGGGRLPHSPLVLRNTIFENALLGVLPHATIGFRPRTRG